MKKYNSQIMVSLFIGLIVIINLPFFSNGISYYDHGDGEIVSLFMLLSGMSFLYSYHKLALVSIFPIFGTIYYTVYHSTVNAGGIYILSAIALSVMGIILTMLIDVKKA